MASTLEQTLDAAIHAPDSPIRYRPLTTDDVERMVETGVLDEDDRVELIKGRLVDMSPPGIRHAAYVRQTSRMLNRIVGDDFIVDVQNPVAFGQNFQSEPDIALLRERAHGYLNSHPTPDDILLLIEVSDPSLNYDQEVKAPLYGEAGVLESWVVSVEDQYIDVYSEPSPGGYKLRRRYTAGESLAVPGVEGASLSVAQVFSLGP